ncbi:MAG TPA: hypothetical protein VGD87_02805, partial [Archangium sp.]
THLCNNACVPDTALATCGGRCSPCPTSTNGTPTCDGTQCGLDCTQGYRACGDTCARCPTGSTATACEGTRCVATACANTLKLCAGECTNCPVASATQCVGNRCVATSCPGGERVCNEECVDVMDVDACGPSCQVCPSPTSNGFRSCDGAQCRVNCSSGYTNCGTQCVTCPSGGGITSSGCSGNTCVPTACNPGYRLCGNTCSVCPEGASTLSCSGTTCIATACTAPLTRCGNSCCGPRVVRVDGLAQNEPVGAAVLLDGGAVFAWDNTIYSSAVRTAELAADGGATTPVNVFDANASGLDLFVDANGEQHLVWVSLPMNQPRVVKHAVRSPGGTWTTENVYSNSNENILEVAGAVGPDGTVRLVYSDFFNPERLRYLEKNGSTWSAPVDVPGAAAGARPREFDIAVDGSNVAHIVSPTSSGLTYTSGGLTTLAAGPIVSAATLRKPAIAVDPSGVVAVAYVEGTSLVLKKLVSGAWTSSTVAPAASDSAVALAFDAAGNAHVFFSGCSTGGTNCGNKYGVQTTSGWVFAPLVDNRLSGATHFAIAVLPSGKAVGAAVDISDGAFLFVP